MNDMILIEKIQIRQVNGLYCLNDLHRASGGEPRHKPDNWLRNQQAIELIDELNASQIREAQNNQQVIHVLNGVGTFVCRELVYAYAMWVSAKFHLAVIRAFDALRSGSLNALPDFTDPIAAAEAFIAAHRAKQTAEQQLAEIAPKAAGFDRISAKKGDFCFTDAAKNLQMHRSDLIAWLQEHGWIYKRNGSDWIAYQDKINRGWLRHNLYDYGSQSGKVATQARVTAKGLAKLAEIFGATL